MAAEFKVALLRSLGRPIKDKDIANVQVIPFVCNWRGVIFRESFLEMNRKLGTPYSAIPTLQIRILKGSYLAYKKERALTDRED
ncbi:Uncharacterized protein FKW44_014782 [Caligus rogercresseyi]|uniref:Uncharacterized protein n=1 Tax=Caligus rogercresseyi TaxID=217165 RepID=A0A7T8JZ90_CALRO|nr:Uncharacterized protein FKW44_014782 [Caligus rogercresseyi]